MCILRFPRFLARTVSDWVVEYWVPMGTCDLQKKCSKGNVRVRTLKERRSSQAGKEAGREGRSVAR